MQPKGLGITEGCGKITDKLLTAAVDMFCGDEYDFDLARQGHHPSGKKTQLKAAISIARRSTTMNAAGAKVRSIADCEELAALEVCLKHRSLLKDIAGDAQG